jgi:hypothetical protein
MTDNTPPKLARRDLLRGLAVAGGAASAGLVPNSASADSFTQEQKKKPRYRVTPDVEAFYRVNRYPPKERRP